MHSNKEIEELRSLLNIYKIGITEKRLLILRAIINAAHSEFTTTQVSLLVKQSNLTISMSSVASTLSLFKNTKLLKTNTARNISADSLRGRPQIKFSLSQPLLKKNEDYYFGIG